jgi:hypothetical protein
MEGKRFIGIDLHRNRFTCCMRLENGRTYRSEYQLEELNHFTSKLRANHELALEMTGNHGISTRP